MMKFDLHTHTTYSDGRLMHRMASAAEKHGLQEIGFADHANVSERQAMIDTKYRNGFNLDKTYDRRLEAIEELRKEKNVSIYNAVEMDYDPRDEKEIKAFFTEKDFDYTLGSVHHLEDVNIHVRDYFANKTEKKRRQLVKDYFDKLEKMIRSEMFDIASHIDLFERNPHLEGFATEEDYRKIAEAFKNSKTIPEINAGRALRGLEELHPTSNFREILVQENISFTAGTDSHRPKDVRKLNHHLDERLDEIPVKVEKPPVLQK